MAEAIQSPFGVEWIMYGQDPGLKTEDLKGFFDIQPAGVIALPGISIGASFYRDLMSYNKFSPQTMSREFRVNANIPPSLKTVNQQIIETIPRSTTIAIRSSGTDESGGTGIYQTVFLTTESSYTNRAYDLIALANAERDIYASYHSAGAMMHRRIGDLGMGILIQPVTGSRLDSYFMPTLSGVLTLHQGRPIIRAAIGLGTKTVDVIEDTHVTILDAKADLDTIKKQIMRLSQADAIALVTGTVRSLAVTEEMKRTALSQVGKLMLMRNVWEDYFNNGRAYYWEFAIDESRELPYVVQSSIDEITEQAHIELGEPEGRLLGESSDLVNSGIKLGKGIFVLRTTQDIKVLEEFNAANKDFLLILPDNALTQAVGPIPVSSFQHFSNAAAILELQGRIHLGKGGSHFAQLCKRRDILFLGVDARGDTIKLDQLLGNPTSVLSRFGTGFYDLRFKVTNTATRGRVEVLDPPIKTEPIVAVQEPAGYSIEGGRELHYAALVLDYILNSAMLPEEIQEALYYGVDGFINLRIYGSKHPIEESVVNLPADEAELLAADLKLVLPWLKEHEDQLLAHTPDHIGGVHIASFNNFLFKLDRILKER